MGEQARNGFLLTTQRSVLPGHTRKSRVARKKHAQRCPGLAGMTEWSASGNARQSSVNGQARNGAAIPASEAPWFAQAR